MKRSNHYPALFAVLHLAAPLCGLGASMTFNTPSLDKWLYSNADGGRSPYGGARDVASIFATLDSEDVDRMGGMLVAFQTGSSIPAGLGADRYAITSIRLTIALASENSFIYDPTYDSYRNFLPVGDARYQADSDAGHPIEVFGVGLRNGYNALSGAVGVSGQTYGEYSPFGTTGAAKFENVYPIGFDADGVAYDVSDNVSAGTEAFPFGIGTAFERAPGSTTPAGTEFTFQLEITNPQVLAYIQESLNRGVVGLYVSSLHAVSGPGGPAIYPRIFTKENELGPDLNPRLEINYAIVPEPKLSSLLIAASAFLAVTRSLLHRDHLS